MPRRLIYAPRAREDLDDIRRWLLQFGSGAKARRRFAAIRTTIRWLREHPFLYPIGDDPGQRELSCGDGYRVIYRLTPDNEGSEAAGSVHIVRVFGPGQSRDQP